MKCPVFVFLTVITSFLPSAAQLPATFPGDLQSPLRFAAGPRPSSIATGDVNGDGKLDAVVANFNDGTLGVYLGNGDGTFAPPTFVTLPAGSSPSVVALADLDGDGKLDIVEADYNVNNLTLGGAVRVLLGNGDGTFQKAVSYTAGKNLTGLAVADFNHDGKLDVAAVDNTSGSASILLNDGTGKLQTPVPYSVATGSYSIAVADLNGDSNPDLVVTNACTFSGPPPLSCSPGSTNNTIAVLLGNADGTFQPAVTHPAGAAPFKIAVADFNGDGKLDIAVTNNLGIAVLIGKGDGTFAPFVTYSGPGGDIFAADFNGDSKVDLMAGLTEFIGNGDGTFTSGVNYFVDSKVSTSLAVADLNGDGHPDLLRGVVDPLLGTSNLDVYLNSFGLMRHSTTTTVTASPSPGFVQGMATLTGAVSASGGATPTGSVTFFSNGQTVSAGRLDNTGKAQISIDLKTTGDLSIVAIYSGDTLTQGSVSSAFDEQVVKNPVKPVLGSTANPSSPGQKVIFEAGAHSVAFFTGSSTFSFFDGPTLLGTVPSSFEGSPGDVGANLEVSNLTVGTHSITVTFSGDDLNAPGTSSVLMQQVSSTPLPLSVTSGSSVTISAGQTATYNLTLQSAGFSGTVTITCSGAPMNSSCTPNPSSASLTPGATFPFTVNVSTQPRNATAIYAPINKPWLPFVAIFVGALVLAARKSARPARLRIGFACAGICVALTFVGCGGGGGSNNGSTGTPAGTYTIIVTATSGSVTNSQNLTLVVN